MKTKKSIYALIIIVSAYLVLLFFIKDYLMNSIILSIFAIGASILLVKIFRCIDYCTSSIKPQITVERKKVIDKILGFISNQKNDFNKNEILPVQYTGESISSLSRVPNSIEVAQHCHWMVIQMEKQIGSDDFDVDKINYELGFIAGCMFSISSNTVK